MKKCPTCDKTFEDSMRFCQTDGTPLVDDEPAFDPYATIVAGKMDLTPPPEVEEPAAEPPAAEIQEEPAAADEVQIESVPEPIAEPEEILDLPEMADPLQTMYVSEAEMQEAIAAIPVEPKVEEPIQPEPPAFSVPDIPAPSFGDIAPPPSPFSVSDNAKSDPEPEAPSFDEAATMMQPPISSPFDEPKPEPPPEPVADWAPTPVSTPAPEAEWTPPPVTIAGSGC